MTLSSHYFLNSSRPLASVLVQMETELLGQKNSAQPSAQEGFSDGSIYQWSGFTLANGDLSSVPAEDVRPLLAGVLLCCHVQRCL